MVGIFLFVGTRVWAADIIAGPMVGHVTDKSARIWMQLSIAKTVTVECYDDTDSQVSAVSSDMEGPLPFVCDIPVNALKPNKSYRIVVKLNGEAVRPPGPDVVIRTTPAPGEEAAFTVGFGSGANPRGAGGGDGAAIFRQINEVKPRAFLFLGDSGKLPEKLEEFPDTRRKAFRFYCDFDTTVRTNPEMQPLLRSAACYGIWGERDFGALGGNKDWIYAKESQAAFQRFWANPNWGAPDNPGCYCTFTIGDADFFLLDERMFRDAENDPARKTMLGDAQLAWLKQGLSESTATFKVIACAGNALADYPANSWRNYQPEQAEFLRWIFAHHVSGVIFVSGGGGRGWGELTGIPRDKFDATTYPLVELTSSALTGGKVPAGPPATMPTSNADRSGSAVTESNFGTLDFSGVREHRFVTMRLRDEKGKIRVEQTLFASQLIGR